MSAQSQTSSGPVFVTGAHGLLGLWLVQELLNQGAQVVVLTRDRPALSGLCLTGLAARCTTVQGDVCDLELLERVLAEYSVTTVFHLAAQTLVGVGERSPLATFESNVRGTWCLLEACRRQRVASVVVASSDKAYGVGDALPYREDQPLLPQHPYETSKAAADMIARSYWHTYGLPVAVTRCANLFGGGDMNTSRLVPELVLAVLAGRPPVLRSDGTPRRDFLYVADAARAYLALAQAVVAGKGCGQAFNIGADRAVAVGVVANLVCELSETGLVPVIEGDGTPEGEISAQYLDSGRFRSLTGWQPQTDLAEGLRDTLDWYRTYLPQLRAANMS